MLRVHCDASMLVLCIVIMALAAGPAAVPAPVADRVMLSVSSDWVAQDGRSDGEPGLGERVGERLRWPRDARARFLVNPVDAPVGAVDAVRSAVATWMRTGVGVALDYGGETTERGANADVVNVVSWIETPDPADVFVARTTTYWFADAPNEIIGFDLVFNLDHAFGIAESGTGVAIDGWDVETIALHEFGHVLGLGHADPERVLQVMRPRISAGEVDHSLSLRDVEALAALYGEARAPVSQGFFSPAPERRFRDAGGGHRPSERGLFD